MPDVIWYLQITVDRKVAYPNEELFASGILYNPNSYPIYIGSCYWYFTCYPDCSPGVNQISNTIYPNGSIVVPPWRLPIPNVPEGQYEAQVSFDTWSWNMSLQNWQDLGRIYPEHGEPFSIIHSPRLRAFISRSNHDVDRPIVESIIYVVQQWGFDTHTVGINEIENEEEKVPERIIQEIVKSDCVFAIATPRDVSSIPAFFRTLTWLHNEVSFSYLAEKPTLLIADETVLLDGLTGTQQIPTIKYSSRDLNAFLQRLNGLMPVIRETILGQLYQKWQQERIKEIEQICYQSFLAGMVVQKKLLLEE
jgi:hypothetical protein